MASRAREMRIVETFVDCNDVLGDQVQLRSRAAENGYLYFPRLLPVEDVVPVRHEILLIADCHVLLREGSDRDKE